MWCSDAQLNVISTLKFSTDNEHVIYYIYIDQ